MGSSFCPRHEQTQSANHDDQAIGDEVGNLGQVAEQANQDAQPGDSQPWNLTVGISKYWAVSQFAQKQVTGNDWYEWPVAVLGTRPGFKERG